MIAIGAQTRILVASEPADFRKGIDGLAQLCRKELQRDPFTGVAFVFRNRRATALKVLWYDGQGFWLCQKRLSKGRFKHWPRNVAGVQQLVLHELQVLLSGGNPLTASGAPPWRPLQLPV